MLTSIMTPVSTTSVPFSTSGFCLNLTSRFHHFHRNNDSCLYFSILLFLSALCSLTPLKRIAVPAAMCVPRRSGLACTQPWPHSMGLGALTAFYPASSLPEAASTLRLVCGWLTLAAEKHFIHSFSHPHTLKQLKNSQHILIELIAFWLQLKVHNDNIQKKWL